MIESIYIHIPFCTHICSYCDFPKVIKNKMWVMPYLESLKKEIELNYKGEKIKTLYIGGGTPSSLNEEELNYLFDILKIINKSELIEYTFECNPIDINEKFLKTLKQNGVNRLSIGIQSFNKDILRYLNRDYDIDIKKVINMSKKYFDNINVDLMYAIEKEKIEDLKEDLKKIIDLDINHISCYSLILEPNTKLYVEHVKEIDEELDYEMYKLIENTLKQNGFNHYEVSNYAKKNYESKHNLNYWNNGKYYGFGLKASGYLDYRYTNKSNLTEYINNNYDKEIEVIDKNLEMEYEMILGLRKLEGVNKDKFFKKYNVNIKDKYDIENLLKENKLKENEEYIYINEDYIYVSNDILLNFIN